MVDDQLRRIARLAGRAHRVAGEQYLVEPEVEVTGLEFVDGLADHLLDDRQHLRIGGAVDRGVRLLDRSLVELRPVAVTEHPAGVADDLKLRNDLDMVALRGFLDPGDVLAGVGLLALGERGVLIRKVVEETYQQHVVLQTAQHVDHAADAVDLFRRHIRQLQIEPAHLEVGPVGDLAALEGVRLGAVADDPSQTLHAAVKPAHVARPDDYALGSEVDGVPLRRLGNAVPDDLETAQRITVSGADDFAALHRDGIGLGERLEIKFRRGRDGEFPRQREFAGSGR